MPNQATDFTMARVFDSVDPATGPRFAPDRPRLAGGGERERILAYLRAGTVVLATTGTMPDIVDPGRGATVPMSFRTDGTWIWTDTVTYYLAEHDVGPDPQLVAHIRAVDGPPPPADDATVVRARAALTAPTDTAPVWPGQ